MNTILILLDRKDPIFYLHQRGSKATIEAQNTTHVVPAGSFNPHHVADRNHEQDFSHYTTAFRELGEELMGDDANLHQVGHIEDLFQRDSVSPFEHLTSIGRGKVIHFGFGLDPVTLKPEGLLAMVFPSCLLKSTVCGGTNKSG